MGAKVQICYALINNYHSVETNFFLIWQPWMEMNTNTFSPCLPAHRSYKCFFRSSSSSSWFDEVLQSWCHNITDRKLVRRDDNDVLPKKLYAEKVGKNMLLDAHSAYWCSVGVL